MDPKIAALISVFKRTATLKELPRTGAIMEGMTRADADTIGGHSHAVSLLAYLVAKELSAEFPSINCDRVAAMSVFHDMAECITGDLPTGFKRLLRNNPDTEKVPDQIDSLALAFLLDDLQARQPITDLIDEYDCCKSPEAKIVKFADIVDAFAHIKARLGKSFGPYLETSGAKLAKGSPDGDKGVGKRLETWLRQISSNWDDIVPKPFPKNQAQTLM